MMCMVGYTFFILIWPVGLGAVVIDVALRIRHRERVARESLDFYKEVA